MTSYYSNGPRPVITDDSTREEQAKRNRERFPEMVEIMDMYPGSKLLWARNSKGDEIGRRPELEPHLFEISAESWAGLQRTDSKPSRPLK